MKRVVFAEQGQWPGFLLPPSLNLFQFILVKFVVSDPLRVKIDLQIDQFG